MIYTFHHLALDSQLYELRQYGKPIHLEPQVFNLLLYLIKHRDRIISKQELLKKLWENKMVSESTLNTCIKAARKAVGDNGRQQKIIATIYRRGYRFIAEVEENGCYDATLSNNHALSLQTSDNDQPDDKSSLNDMHHPNIEQRPSISIAPIAHNLKTEYIVWLAEIVTEGINRHLAQIPSYIVIHPHQASANYVLTGSIRKINSHFKLSLQLLETATGQFLWANHQTLKTKDDQSQEEKLAEIVHGFITQIEPELNRAELTRLNHQPLAQLDAWALYRKTEAILAQKGWNEESCHTVSLLLNEAIQHSPPQAFIYAHWSFFLSIRQLIGLNHDNNWKQKAIKAAETAIELDNQHTQVLSNVGFTLAITGDYERGKHLLQHALERNADNANAWAALGVITLRQQDESGLEQLRHGIAISPQDNRVSVWEALLSYGLLSLKRTEKALQTANHVCQCDDKILLPRVVSTLAHHTIGHDDKARLAWQDVLRISPKINRQALYQLVSQQEIQQLQALNIFPTHHSSDKKLLNNRIHD